MCFGGVKQLATTMIKVRGKPREGSKEKEGLSFFSRPFTLVSDFLLFQISHWGLLSLVHWDPNNFEEVRITHLWLFCYTPFFRYRKSDAFLFTVLRCLRISEHLTFF